MKYSLIILFCILSVACTNLNHKVEEGNQNSGGELLKFAEANCFFWYFKKKGYDLQDIRAISGGIVETGSYSSEKYQQVSLLVKGYTPPISTKQGIDIDLFKCFQLGEDMEFINSLQNIK